MRPITLAQGLATCLLILAAACGEPAASAIFAQVSTIDHDPVRDGCFGLAISNATLRGDPADPRVTWLEFPHGRTEIVWPRGYSARFVPRLEVLNERGQVAIRGGDSVGAACALADDTLLMVPPFQDVG